VWLKARILPAHDVILHVSKIPVTVLLSLTFTLPLPLPLHHCHPHPTQPSTYKTTSILNLKHYHHNNHGPNQGEVNSSTRLRFWCIKRRDPMAAWTARVPQVQKWSPQRHAKGRRDRDVSLFFDLPVLYADSVQRQEECSAVTSLVSSRRDPEHDLEVRVQR
jgi:hypothetical protein